MYIMYASTKNFIKDMVVSLSVYRFPVHDYLH